MARHDFQKPSTESKATRAADWIKPAGTCLGLLLLLAGLSLLWRGLGAAPGEKHEVDFHTYGLNYFWNFYFSGIKAHKDFIIGMVLLGGAAGFIGVAWGWFDSVSPEASVKPGLFYGVSATLAVFIALFILHYGMHQFGGYDLSHLVDSGWRLFKGQTAYVDFPCTTPVAYILGAKFAFQWFGVHWHSFIEINALFAVASFAWSIVLLVGLFGLRWSVLLWAVAMQAFSTMLSSYWWYNPTAAVSAVLYMLSATYWLRRPAQKRALVSYSVALLLLATMKVNVAGTLIPGISVILFASRNHRWKVLGVSLGAFALFMVILSINHLSLSGMLTGYFSVAQRGASLVPFLIDLDPLEKCLALLELISILLPAVLALSQGGKSLRSLTPWIPATAMLVGFMIFVSNNENKPVGVKLSRSTSGPSQTARREIRLRRSKIFFAAAPSRPFLRF
jgi:hypothetical protein